MYKKIFDLLSEHSVALAILIANIVAAIIISRAASKDKFLQNKYQDTKDTLQILLKILQQLEAIQVNESSELLEIVSTLILNCKKALHLISKSKNHFPMTLAECKKLHDFFSEHNAIGATDASVIKKMIPDFYTKLNSAIQSEWLEI